MRSGATVARGKTAMPKTRTYLSTGIPDLDHVFRGFMPGDNIVWQVGDIAAYAGIVAPFVRYAAHHKQKIVYFRFANHDPLIEENEGVRLCELFPENGFEPFIADVHRIIHETGRGGLYVFDCLSELAPGWCSDRMLGNFFMLTCPRLYDRAAIAYFAILRNRHSFHALRPISHTTQVLADVYRHKNKTYIQPLKAQYRHSPTMFMLHAWEEDNTFVPVRQSCVITDVLKGEPWSRLESANYMLGYWSHAFQEAETLQASIDRGQTAPEAADALFKKILRMLVSRDEKVLQLAERHFTLRDLLAIRARMIGTGMIGGKTTGMLLARAMLRSADAHWQNVLEDHDSFYIGADVFYTYLVQNGCWWTMRQYKGDGQSDDETETVRRRILAGDFPEYIVRQFSDMLDYFGQSPVIVRSSSLLEDSFGHAFAGKYDSVFCANQGGSHKRLEDFLFAVRTVYASVMGEDALAYRAKRNLAEHDEQMGLLVQRVSGSAYGSLFFPQAAGVGFSYNPYVWHESIDPDAGMLRLVFGMGTRAVDRSDDDYTRIVAMNAPEIRPEGNREEARKHSQRRVDVLDLEGNRLASKLFDEILDLRPEEIPMDLFAARDPEQARLAAAHGLPPGGRILSFEKLLRDTGFVQDMRDMLTTLKDGYSHHVDIEFTLNFFEPDRYRINLVQCRPLEAVGARALAEPDAPIADPDILVRSGHSVVGTSRDIALEWIVYVVPNLYAELSVNDRHALAHRLGKLLNLPALREEQVFLAGPGRWGTTTPSLGVPVSFSDIGNVAVLCEIAAMGHGIAPDISLGTHFFNELVENDLLYMAVAPEKEGNRFDFAYIEDPSVNALARYAPELCAAGADAIRLLRPRDLPGVAEIRLRADMFAQQATLYIRRNQP